MDEDEKVQHQGGVCNTSLALILNIACHESSMDEGQDTGRYGQVIHSSWPFNVSDRMFVV